MDDWLWKRCPHCDGTGEYINPADLRAVWRCPHCNVLHQVRAPDAEAKVRAWEKVYEAIQECGCADPVIAHDLLLESPEVEHIMDAVADALKEAADD